MIVDLISIYFIVWVLKTAVEDTAHAVKGTPNQRYELRKQKALAAGKRAPAQPRYGSRDWFADLVSDGLAAQTERRRAKAAKKAKAAADQAEREERPLDDLAEAVREEPQRPAPARVDTEEFPEPEWLTPDPDEGSEDPVSVVHDDQHPYCATPCGPNCVRHGWSCNLCGVTSVAVFVTRAEAEESHRQHTCYSTPHVACRRCGNRHPQEVMARIDGDWACPDCARWFSRVFAAKLAEQRTPDGPDAVIIPFPTNIEKEISMATSEVNGLTTALAFATAAADAHASFATGGSEGYTGALAGWEVGDGCIGLAREAQEASQIAAAKWQAHVESLKEQLKVKEAYQGAPDAGNKQFLLNG